MLRIPLEPIFEELMTFNTGDSLDEDQLRAFVVPLIEAIVEASNSDPDEGRIWDVIHQFENLLKGNYAVEAQASRLYHDILKYRRTHGYDPRLKMCVRDPRRKPHLFVLVTMDLDGTLKALQTEDISDEQDIEDLVSANPTPDQLNRLEKAQ